MIRSPMPPMRVRVLSGLALAVLTSACGSDANFSSTAPSITPPTTSTTPVSVPSSVTPWSSLPPISDAAKNLVVNYNLNLVYRGADVGAVKRWASGASIRVYADPAFRPQDVVTAINTWQAVLAGKITFVIVGDATSADVVFTFDSSITDPGVCGLEGADNLVGNVITHGSGRYATRPGCVSSSNDWSLGLTHGLGHILWIGGHTAPGTDIMSSSNPIFVMSPLLSESTNWVYSVPPGTKPQ